MISPWMLVLALGAPPVALAGAGQQELETLSATTLLDQAIEDPDGDFPGWVRDLVLDAQGAVRLLVVELSGPSRRSIGVPWSYITIRRDGTLSWRATDEELRRAPTYSTRGSAVTGSDEGLVSYAPTDDDVERFDPAKATTFRGVVTGTMSGSFQQDVEEVVAVVDLGSGQTIHARLGPELYLTQIGLGLAPGQTVVLEGFALEGEDQPLVVVSKIMVQDRTFVLRNLEGTPLWTRPSRRAPSPAR
jgi:hypothetical protein